MNINNTMQFKVNKGINKECSKQRLFEGWITLKTDKNTTKQPLNSVFQYGIITQKDITVH